MVESANGTTRRADAAASWNASYEKNRSIGVRSHITRA